MENINDDEEHPYSYYADVYVVRDLLASCKVGDIITFQMIEDVLNRPVDGSVYGAIHNAQKLVEKEHRLVFGNVRNVGYKCLNDKEIIEHFEVDRRRLRKRAQRAARRLTNVKDYAALSPENKMTHQAGLGVLAAISRVTSPSMIESIRQEERAVQSQVPIGRILELMRDKEKE